MGVGREHTDLWYHKPVVPYKMREVGEQLKTNLPIVVDGSVSSCFAFGRFGVQISAQRLAVLTDVFQFL
jgi:hypothetical protein